MRERKLITLSLVLLAIIFLYSNYHHNDEVIEEDDSDYSAQHYRMTEELAYFDSLPSAAIKYKYLKYATGDGSRPKEGICENIKLLQKEPAMGQESYRICMDRRFGFDGSNCLVYSYGFVIFCLFIDYHDNYFYS